MVLVDRAGHPGPYDMGSGFDRILLIVDDIDAHVRASPGLRVPDHRRSPTSPSEIPVRIVMAQDPDGYGLELIEQPA